MMRMSTGYHNEPVFFGGLLGPRFKTAVVTTNLPLAVDQPRRLSLWPLYQEVSI